MERQIIKAVFFGMVFISSCYYDNAEELYPQTECITANMSLQTNIEPILDRNCYVCHSTVAGPSNGNVILEEYEELVKYATDGRLVSAIKHESDFPMPNGASKLGNCDIAKIESWVNAGAPNN
jgi:mono/diheme cytochrome c family protein